MTRLRRLERDDLTIAAAWTNDPDVRNSLLIVYPLSLEHENEWFQAQLRRDPACQPFVIETEVPAGADAAAGGKEWRPIGVLGFHELSWRTRCAEFGIFIGERTQWGRGLGTDAARTLIRWGFLELNLNRVWLRVFDDNARAIRSYEKLGFVVEGRLRQDRYHDGRHSDTLVMGLLRGEFPD
jgi:RimJ/RimL family protein N-acetyltransferase